MVSWDTKGNGGLETKKTTKAINVPSFETFGWFNGKTKISRNTWHLTVSLLATAAFALREPTGQLQPFVSSVFCGNEGLDVSTRSAQMTIHQHSQNPCGHEFL